jgi:molybdate transport system substrate-binding protein
MHVAGTEIVGLLPDELNLITEFAAGLMPDRKNADAAMALIQMLKSPEAGNVFRAKGLDPS